VESTDRNGLWISSKSGSSVIKSTDQKLAHWLWNSWTKQLFVGCGILPNKEAARWLLNPQTKKVCCWLWNSPKGGFVD
jgi:hypothetical protein